MDGHFSLGICAHPGRSDGHLLGYPSNFTIYDTSDLEKPDHDYRQRAAALTRKVYNRQHLILGRISSGKNNLITAQGYNNDDEITIS
ncbi:MAG: hypothetical protein U5L09_07720 [Bacteroidales bacterium]|nr:hypothetical protein [Bacteroidales bacterium]